MKAWEKELSWIKSAIPKTFNEDEEKNWLKYLENGIASDEKLFRDWESFVPGSLAPCHLIVGAIGCMNNKGYDVSLAESIIESGLKAAKEKDGAKLQQITAKVYNILNNAPKDLNSSYWNFEVYKNWSDIEKTSIFPVYETFDVSTEKYYKQVYAGWLGQLIGGSLGTQIEGYTTENIKKVFGNIEMYTRPPETYNDDITYELAFLEAFCDKGYDVTSEDIAYQWLSLIPDGYSAEEVALNNLRHGIMPPLSGTYNNYYSDWIGAQMRTPLHGMVAPGNPKMAAKLAVFDSVISHSNNGMLGGMFNAVLISLCFVESDIKKIVTMTLEMIPHKSEYYSIGKFVVDTCKSNENWENAWSLCEERLQEYHWIHAYPNLAAEIVALWFGDCDFDKTANIIAMAGQDVDCTAAPVLNAIGIIKGVGTIDSKWVEPLGENIHTFMRKYKEFTLKELVDKTVFGVRR